MDKINTSALLVICLIFLFNCSFGSSKVWNDLSKELEIAKSREGSKVIFSSAKKFDKTIKNKSTVRASKPLTNQNWSQQNLNNGNHVPHLNYQNKKNLILKSKKLGKNSFDLISEDFQPIIENGVLFFYDPSGNILSYSIQKEELIWKYNFYKKRFKNIPKEISLHISKENIIISDNLGFIYSLNKETGKIKWAKSYGVPFRSNIKVDDGNIFLINQDNKFYAIDEITGEQKLDLETIPSFLKSKSKSNISMDENRKNVYFITSAAEIYSLNYQNRNINWFYSLTGGNTDQQSDLFYSSPVVYLDDKIFASTFLSTFCMDSTTGALNWDFRFSTKISPLVLKNNVYVISQEGFLVNLDREKGKVIWSLNLFDSLKKLNYEKTGNINSILFLSGQIFVATEKGYFLFLNPESGEMKNYTKVSKGFFSKPVIWNETLLIIDNKMRVLQFN